ncbi:MAG TPA: hypothetical protein VFP58_03430 [Candidatus Eisenbacteria bacterium]|nr:hypothetical protein [Candidatus Eisenbacteria bacterium]
MKTVRIVAWILPLAVITLGCERTRTGSDRVTSPAPAAPASPVIEARWVWDKGLNDAIQRAATSPLVQRVVEESPFPGARPVWSMAVRAEGRTTGGRKAGVTILPYSVNGDPTHAFFVSLYEHEGEEIAEPAELIVGRAPTHAETGFTPIRSGDGVLYVKTGAPYAAGAAGMIRLSPERRNWAKFFQCWAERAPQYCSSFASIADEIAPHVPHAMAIGCGVGVAIAGLECLFGSR